MKVSELTAVVVNYNGIETVLDTIRSIQGQRGVACRIVVVDDGSSDGSPEAIQRCFPDVRLEREPRNTRQVNRLRNRGLRLATTAFVLITDNDVRFEPDCALRLLDVMGRDNRVGVCIPRLMAMDDSRRIAQTGGLVHYVGTTIAPDRGDVWVEDGEESRLAVGGGIALFRRAALQRVGLFDEAYALAWGDDGELHQRFLLAGYQSLYVSGAVGYHDNKPFDASRHYRARGQIRNRWRFMLTHYSARTLLAILPALLVYEVLVIGFFLLWGLPYLYVLGTADAIRDLPAIRRRRAQVQGLRVEADRSILFAGPLYARVGGVAGRVLGPVLTLMSGLFAMYWRLVQPLLGRNAGETWHARG